MGLSLGLWGTITSMGLALEGRAHAQAAPVRRLLAQNGETPAPGTGSSASGSATAAPNDDAAVVEVEPDSPQASMRRFLKHARAARYVEAGEYLDVGRGVDAADAARKLVIVLDRLVWIDLDRLSPESLGDRDDGLPRSIDTIGTIDGGSGRADEPVRIGRSMTSHGPRWRFTRATCERIDPWYRSLDGRFLRDHIPRRLLRAGWWHIQIWQWIGLGIAFVGALFLGLVIGRLNQWLFSRIAKRTPAAWDEALVTALGLPLRLAWALVIFYVAIPFLGLVKPAEATIHRLQNLAAVLVFLVACIRAVGSFAASLSRSEWGQTNPSSRSLVGLSARAATLAAFVVAVLITLSTLGYDVTGVLAGLGVGGVVLALAAQKTVENLLGAFALGIDQPLREGDIVSIDGVIGTVEKVGLRSTRIRTVDRHVVAFPNGKLADTPIESLATRERMRLATTIGVQHGTSTAKLREVRAALERVVGEHPLVAEADRVIRFSGIGTNSLEFTVVVFFSTIDYPTFVEAREELLLAMLGAIEGLGVELYAPVRLGTAGGPAAPAASAGPR